MSVPSAYHFMPRAPNDTLLILDGRLFVSFIQIHDNVINHGQRVQIVMFSLHAMPQTWFVRNQMVVAFGRILGHRADLVLDTPSDALCFQAVREKSVGKMSPHNTDIN